VNAALGFVKARPAAGAFALALTDGARAGPAADRAVAAVLQWIVGNLVLADVAPDLLADQFAIGLSFRM
jgi:hypothetical protein